MNTGENNVPTGAVMYRSAVDNANAYLDGSGRRELKEKPLIPADVTMNEEKVTTYQGAKDKLSPLEVGRGNLANSDANIAYYDKFPGTVQAIAKIKNKSKYAGSLTGGEEYEDAYGEENAGYILKSDPQDPRNKGYAERGSWEVMKSKYEGIKDGYDEEMTPESAMFVENQKAELYSASPAMLLDQRDWLETAGAEKLTQEMRQLLGVSGWLNRHKVENIQGEIRALRQKASDLISAEVDMMATERYVVRKNGGVDEPSMKDGQWTESFREDLNKYATNLKKIGVPDNLIMEKVKRQEKIQAELFSLRNTTVRDAYNEVAEGIKYGSRYARTKDVYSGILSALSLKRREGQYLNGADALRLCRLFGGSEPELVAQYLGMNVSLIAKDDNHWAFYKKQFEAIA